MLGECTLKSQFGTLEGQGIGVCNKPSVMRCLGVMGLAACSEALLPHGTPISCGTGCRRHGWGDAAMAAKDHHHPLPATQYTVRLYAMPRGMRNEMPPNK